MAKYCKTCMVAACDCCKWYDFNGDEDGCHTGGGCCRRHDRKSAPTDACRDYECHTLKQGDEWFDTGMSS